VLQAFNIPIPHGIFDNKLVYRGCHFSQKDTEKNNSCLILVGISGRFAQTNNYFTARQTIHRIHWIRPKRRSELQLMYGLYVHMWGLVQMVAPYNING